MNGATRSILYVEDDENDVFFFRRALKEAGVKSSLVVIESGRAAIDYLANVCNGGSKAPDCPGVVLLDLNMPEIGGFEVLRWIRQNSKIENLPVVIFSSSSHWTDIERARELRADGYQVKPSDLARRIAFARELSERWCE